MAEKNEILNTLTELTTEVANAREGLLKGEVVRIDGVHAQIEAQCELIVDLDPEDAAEIKPALDGLLDDLRLFSAEIEYVQAKVAEILKEAEETAISDGDTPTEP